MTIFQKSARLYHSIQHHYLGHPLRLCTAAIKTILLTHVFWEHGFTIGPCYGASMLPTFEVIGDHILVAKRYRRGRGVKVGDIIEFESVVEPGEKVIKTLVGMEGDYVLRDSPGANSRMIQVPRGHCWVVGDNMDYSRDSRHFGPLPLALIKGKVIAKVLPWSERRWIENNFQHVALDDH